MSQIVLDILSQIGSLTQEVRAELAHAFLNSLDMEEDQSAAEFDADLDARLEDIEARTASGRSLEDVIAEIS